MKARNLYIVIGCDADPDRPGFVDGAEEGKSWRGIKEGIPLLKNLLAEVKDSRGQNPKITWLIRVDEQINRLYGDYGWVLRRFKDYLAQLESGGDELGWHPHFYQYDEKSRRWYQEIADTSWQARMLERAHVAYNSEFPGRPRSVRMGWDYHNNVTMAALDRLGVTIDFSALPGLKTKPAGEKSRTVNVYDWSISPKWPYYPSANDYRRSALASEQALGIMELPIFVSSSMTWGLISGLQMARKMKDPSLFFQALRRPSYVINITGKPGFFAPLISELKSRLKASADENLIFATYFHADELLDNKSTIYSRHNFLENVSLILKTCNEFQIEPQFARASETKTIFQPTD